MRRKLFSMILIVSFLLLSACGGAEGPADRSSASDTSVGSEKITFTDALGQEFSLDQPQRVVVMIGSFTDVWLMAGGEKQLVATANDAWESYELDLGEDVVNFGSPKKPSLELILAAQPDLIIASSLSPSNLELQENFQRAGIPAAYFDVDSVEDFLELLELFSQLSGYPEASVSYMEGIRTQVAAAKEKIDGSAPTVLNLQVSGSSCKVKNSQDNVLGQMLLELDCVNIADRDDTLLEDLSLEAILQADPDFIFAVYHGTDTEGAQANLEAALLSNPAWSSLRAVQEGRFYLMERRMFNLKPNALWGDSYEQLAAILYGA